MDRALESPRFPLSGGQDRSQLLFKRVTTVQSFRQDISCRRNKDTSEMLSPNGIPVPLYPGETIQQYTHKFERWLIQRGESLVKLRNDPSRERNFWFSFAYQRAQQVREKKRSIPNNADIACYDAESKRLRLEEHLHVTTSRSELATEELGGNISLSTGVSSQGPIKDEPYDGLGSSGSQVGPIVPQRSRKEVLAKRVLTQEEYLGEILERRQNLSPYEPPSKLRKIPVPLYPGETFQDYEKEFRCWLYKHHQSIKSLRSQPLKERGFRCQFALDKVTTRSAGCHGRLDATTVSPRQPTANREAAAVEHCHFSQISHNMESRRIETKHSIIHCESEIRTNSTTDSKESLPQASEESRHKETGDVDLVPADSETFSSQPSDSDLEPGSAEVHRQVSCTRTLLSDSLPRWAELIIDRVGKLERQVTILQQEFRNLQIAQSDSYDDASCAKPRDGVECEAKSFLPDRIESVGKEADEKKGILDVGLTQNFTHEPNDPHGDLASTSHFQTKDNSKMRRLTKAYCFLANKVTASETAIDEALAYLKESREAGDFQAIEKRNEIMKLVVSINQEKRKRSSALVDLLVNEWCGEEETLISMLQEDLSTTHKSNAKHDKLVEISLRLERKFTDLDKLEAQFSEQVQLVNTLPPSVTEAGKSLRLKKLREVSGKILEEQTERDLLKENQRDVLLCFMRGDDEIRKLMMEVLLQIQRHEA
ncbi:hypothetical protein L916_15081 [Phytophthora nicotianae]|uniref:Uncharacterized protein n=1 Tax=Phytophthora nicotianae TaxID=4792 RepID=W2IG30_PHYNI|nr:hypothetical protein L916_15081 [Phytophthora nicotianae]